MSVYYVSNNTIFWIQDLGELSCHELEEFPMRTSSHNIQGVMQVSMEENSCHKQLFINHSSAQRDKIHP